MRHAPFPVKLILLLLLVLPLDINAQFADSSFVRYTFKEGLSSNYITSIQQDELGYIWVGTEVGLNRFDGFSFKKFNDEHFQLPSGSIKNIKKIEPGKLAIISARGLHVLSTKDLSIKYYYIPDSSLLSTYRNAAWDAQLLPDGSIAVSTATGFYVFGPAGELRVRHDAFTLQDYGKRILYGRDILRVSANDLLIYTHNYGLAHYAISSKKYHEMSPGEKQWDVLRVQPPGAVSVHSTPVPIRPDEYLFFYLLEDSIGYYDDRIQKLVKSQMPFYSNAQINWQSRPVAINDSLFAVNSGNGGFYTFLLDRRSGIIRFDPHKYLTGHTINVLFVDKNKRLWAGTRNGLLRQRIHKNFLQSRYYEPAPGDLAVVGFQSCYPYKDKLYVTRYSRTNGLVVLDTATGNVIKRVQFYGPNTSWNEINSIIMYHPDTLWLGTDKGALWLDTKTYTYGKLFDPAKYPLLPEVVPHFYPVNKDGYAWFFYFMEGVVVRYHVASRHLDIFGPKTKTLFPFNRIKSIAYDSYGDVWFGGHALARWNSREEKFDTMMTVYGGVNKYNDNILALTADNNGSLWLHNAENGLLEFRIREKRFVAYTTKEGLPSSVLQCLSPVVNNILWIASANSLARFDIKTKKSFIYDHNDGFPDESPNNRRIFYDKERNDMYLFCNNFIVRFPATISKPSTESGELLIQEFRVNDNKSWYHPDRKIKLKHNENTINLQFNTIEFESPNSYQFSYRLDKEKEWTLAGLNRSIQFKGLPPGQHTIRLKMSGKNGEEKLKELDFFIAKPFWKTTGFLLSVVLLCTAIGVWLYRRRMYSIHQKANIDKQIAQTQMKALHAQMNPHFVFNSLNSIREMILNNESKEASHFLSKFAQLMRMTLDHSVRNFISLRSTMEYLERYMEMEQIRNSYFTCRILAEEDLDPDETYLPPMLIQPFIENAIWHGVTGTRKDININIDFIKEGEQLVCIIDDNGMGINRSLEDKKNKMGAHTPVGIANIRNRIQLLNEKYGLACSVDIIDKSILPGEGNGTKVTIRLPLDMHE
ncbi:MAG TPA: histidine kinase [Chitinophagaceae bacterium]|nr:histidine kinase [Chitinophagaceae bacterium]